MSESCDHVVGFIANKPYTAAQWPEAMRAFARVVQDFNVRGQRDEIPHPGYEYTAQYCVHCGAKLDSGSLLTFAEAYTEISPLPVRSDS